MIAPTHGPDRGPEGARSLRDYLEALRRRLWLVGLLVLLGVGLAYVYGARTPDVYEVSTEIDIAKQRPLLNAPMSFGEGYMESQLYYPTRYSLLASRTYADRLFREKDAADGTVSFPMWDWLTWPAYGAAPPAVDPEEDLGLRVVGAADFEALVGVRPEDFRRRYAFSAYGPPEARDPSSSWRRPSDLVGLLANRVTVTPRKGTTLVDIALEGERPTLLAPLLNLLIEVFSREQRSEMQRRLDRQHDLLEDQREEIAGPVKGRARLRARVSRGAADEKPLLRVAEDKVEAWQKEKLIDGPTLEQEKARLGHALEEHDRAIRDASARLAAARARIDALVPDRTAIEKAARDASKAADGSPAAADSAADAETLKALGEVQSRAGALGPSTSEADARALASLPFVVADVAVADASGRLSVARAQGSLETSEVVKALRAARNEAVRNAVLTAIAGAQQDLGIRLETRLQQAKDEAARRDRWAQSADLSALTDARDRVKKDLQRVEETLKEVEQQSLVERDLKPLKVIERAGDPVLPVRPNRPLLLLIGGGLGLLLGASLALFLDWMDDSVGDPRDVERWLRSPVVGTIVAMPGGAGASADRIAHEQPRSPVTEAYRAVRTAVEFAPSEGPGGRVLLVSSCSPREGKTTVAINLATVLAQDGKRTLLVDADLRKPRLHEVLKVPAGVGLSNLVAGRATAEEAIHPAGPENLWVLPSGAIPPNPAELLGRPATAALLERLRKDFDRIVLDTPPLGVVTDAAVLARHADIVLLVVAAGKTKKRAAEHGAHVLRSVGVEPAGVVLNQVRRGSRWAYGGFADGLAAGYYGGDKGGV